MLISAVYEDEGHKVLIKPAREDCGFSKDYL